MLFTALDDDDDDRLSLDELKKLSADPRLKQIGPAAIALAFPSLDQDQDGVLTIDEFRKLRDLFRRKR
jgi:Ca2+-binding EF-hand superfamily protein